MESFKDIANVPNAITGARLVGAAGEAVAYARTGKLRHLLGAGAAFLLDIADGPAARHLHQETEFGEMADPVVDKATVAAVVAATVMQGTVDTAPLMAVGAIDASNIAATTVAKARGVDCKVPKNAKWAQLLMNTGYGLNVIGNHLRKSENRKTRTIGTVLRIGGGALAVGSAGTMGVRSTKHYWRNALQSKA